MSDRYPERIEFKVERDALRRYLRAKWLLSWVAGLLFFGVMIGMGTVTRQLKGSGCRNVPELILLTLSGIGSGVLGSALVSFVLYLLLSHRLAARIAGSLRVTVDGAFLRIEQHGFARVDRKMHFRAIVDYATVQGWLMRRFGVTALHMRTIAGGGPPQGGIEIIGLADCAEVRDKLVEIDSLREKA